MPTTFANSINNNEIYAKRAECDAVGSDIQQTYATKSEVTTGLSSKQDTISDLATIRSGAQAGATAVQPADLATVATTGAYSDLSGTPTIPPALSAGNGIDITNDTVSVDLDGTSLTNGANGLSVTLPVPDTTGASQGDVLSVGQSGIEWVTPGGSGGGDDVVLTYNVSTWSDFITAYNAGKNIRVVETISGATYEAVLFEYNPNGSPYGYAKFTATSTKTESGSVTYRWYQISNTGSGVWTHGAGTLQGTLSGEDAIVVTPSTRKISLTLDGSSLTQSSSGLAVANPLPSTLGTAGQVLQVNSGATGVEWATPSGGSTGLFEAVYGQTSYSDIVQAISDKKIVYCRVSPSGASRMAFLAYVGSSNVEFQYYRSLSNHTASNQTDEVYVYTVSSSGWTTTTRLAGIKYIAGTNMSQSYNSSNSTLTFSATMPTVDQTYDGTSTNAQSGVAVAEAIADVNQVPASTSSDSGKVLTVNAQGVPGWVTGGGGGGGAQANWTEADPSDPSYIQNKPAPKTLTAGDGISVTESASTINVSADVSALTAAQIQSLKEALGVDETVLYSGMATIATDGVATYHLSESPLNFQYIKVYFCANDNTFGSTGNVGSSYTEWDTQIYTAPSTLLSVYMDGNASATAITKYAINCDVSGIQTSTWSAQGYLNDATGNAKWFHIFKIVGRHRIASN